MKISCVGINKTNSKTNKTNTQVFYFSIYALENKLHGAQVEYLKSSTTYIMINKKHRCIDAKNTSNFKTL